MCNLFFCFIQHLGFCTKSSRKCVWLASVIKDLQPPQYCRIHTVHWAQHELNIIPYHADRIPCSKFGRWLRPSRHVDICLTRICLHNYMQGHAILIVAKGKCFKNTASWQSTNLTPIMIRLIKTFFYHVCVVTKCTSALSLMLCSKSISLQPRYCLIVEAFVLAFLKHHIKETCLMSIKHIQYHVAAMHILGFYIHYCIFMTWYYTYTYNRMDKTEKANGQVGNLISNEREKTTCTLDYIISTMFAKSQLWPNRVKGYDISWRRPLLVWKIANRNLKQTKKWDMLHFGSYKCEDAILSFIRWISCLVIGFTEGCVDMFFFLPDNLKHQNHHAKPKVK